MKRRQEVLAKTTLANSQGGIYLSSLLEKAHLLWQLSFNVVSARLTGKAWLFTGFGQMPDFAYVFGKK